MTTDTSPPLPDDHFDHDFDPVPVRPRADGWTSDRQAGFLAALSRTANVEAACRAVGMGTSSAYELRARVDAAAFRHAWKVALDYAVHRLAEAALDRAINGTANPVFYKGEQVGEHRRYDEKLTMFILRMRDPERYGRWRDDRVPMGQQDEKAKALHHAVALADNEARAIDFGFKPDPMPTMYSTPMLTREQDARLTPWWERVAERITERVTPRRRRGARAEPDTGRGV
jgi:hypothetical protein